MKKLMMVLIFLPTVILAQTGIITTVAGTGSAGYSGDGGPATAAKFSTGFAGVFNKRGEYFFADRINHCVRKITPSGIIYTYAGTGVRGYNGDGILATTAKLNNPKGLAIDTNDNIFIAEVEGGRIRKIDATTNRIYTYAGTGGFPYGCSFGTDSGDGGQATASVIAGALYLCFDRHQNLYVSTGPSNVRKIDAMTGIISRVANDGTCTGGFGGDGGQATNAKLNQPTGICTDTFDNLYIADLANVRVRKVDATAGIITTVVGNGTYTYNGEGLTATSAQISAYDVKIDKQGNLIVGEYLNSRIRKVTPSGFVYTIAGTGTQGFSGDGGPATAADIYWTGGIAINDCNEVYFQDFGNNRVRKISYGNNLTIAISSSTTSNLCYPMPVTFTARTTYAGSTPTYQWKVNGVTVGMSTPTYTYTPATGDSIQCVLTSSLYCVTNPMDTSNAIHMTVGSLTPPTVAVTGDSIKAAGTTVNLSASITGASGSYVLRWRNHGMEFTTTATPPVSYTKPAGTDTITAAMICTNRGCYDSVVSAGHLVWDHNVAVSSLQSVVGSLRVYPNPVGDELLVEAGDPVTGIRIVDVLGRVIDVPEKGTMEGILRMDVSHLSPGIYFVKIMCKEGEVAKVIVKK